VSPPRELLEQEVSELTDLLRNDESFADLRDALASKGVPPSTTILAGFMESEDYIMYGVVLTEDRRCIRFEIDPDGNVTQWDLIEDLDVLADDFQAVNVGVEMLDNGDIS
jgi:hypothetical protein